MHFSLFQNLDNSQWYWSFLAADDKIIAAGGEAFATRREAIASINLVRVNAFSSTVFDHSQDKCL